MSSPKKSTVVDPDYEINEVARERVRLREDQVNKEKCEQIKDIIDREFQTELGYRQSQLELIQHRINEAQKTLHLLRYVLVNSYYGSKDTETNQFEESNFSIEEHLSSNKSRLHPAVKKLLGNCSNDYNLSITNSPRKKVKYLDESSNSYTFCNENIPTICNVSPVQEKNEENSTININNVTNTIKEVYDTVRNRKKVKHRLVVGNISKWMPSESEEDKSTHKWMVYVRGSKEKPDISHFVKKVVFYLHHSYQPNDVVELRHPPFHLSRRGWGEFPLRVKIFFQYDLNKPVDIIHNLKLDKTYTGQQTLGNETVVDLFLYRNEETELQENVTDEIKNELPEQIKIKEEIDLDNDVEDIKLENKSFNVHVYNNSQNNASNLEHDYCFLKLKQEIKSEPPTDTSYNSLPNHYDYLIEHSYARNQSSLSKNCNTFTQEESNNSNIATDLNKSEIIENIILDNFTARKKNNNFQKVIISNGTVISVKKRKRPQESLLKKCYSQHNKYSTKIDSDGRNCNKFRKLSELTQEIDDGGYLINYEKHKIDFRSSKFKNVYEALPYLFKRLPLITMLVLDLDYKCTYPYVAKTLEEYFSWHIGKRLSSEWFRAKLIFNMVTEAKLMGYKNLTVKDLIMYGRSHGYTPLANYQIFKNKNNLIGNILNGTPTENSVNINEKMPILTEPDDVIDVMGTEDPGTSTNFSHKEKLIDHKLELACSYVKQTLLDVGIILKPEEIVPGILYNAGERILLQAALCLAEDIIRRARANLVCQGNFCEETTVIGSEEILRALCDRSQFQILSKSNS